MSILADTNVLLRITSLIIPVMPSQKLLCSSVRQPALGTM